MTTPMAVAGYRYRELPEDVLSAMPEESALTATVHSVLDTAEAAERT